MTTTALLLAIAYGSAVVVGCAFAIFLWRTTRRHAEVDAERLAGRERGWLWIVLALLLALLLATIFSTPYGESAPRDGTQLVQVNASQFAWEIRPAVIRAGTPVEFRLRSSDVNHAFGVYDPQGKLVFQVQVMPGRTQKAVETFADAGRYEILCLEFCGFLHHGMVGSFEVRR